MPKSVTYRCSDCGSQFNKIVWPGDSEPECPTCAHAPPMARIPGMFAIATNVSRAIDFAQKMAETQYGLTDLKDNLRDGDIAAPKPQMQTPEALNKLTREMREQYEASVSQAPADPVMAQNSFFQGGGATGGALPQADPQAIAAYSAETKASGADAVSLVEKAKNKGVGGMRLHVHGSYTETP